MWIQLKCLKLLQFLVVVLLLLPHHFQARIQLLYLVIIRAPVQVAVLLLIQVMNRRVFRQKVLRLSHLPNHLRCHPLVLLRGLFPVRALNQQLLQQGNPLSSLLRCPPRIHQTTLPINQPHFQVPCLPRSQFSTRLPHHLVNPPRCHRPNQL
jgi:hypothetical protein